MTLNFDLDPKKGPKLKMYVFIDRETGEIIRFGSVRPSDRPSVRPSVIALMLEPFDVRP